MAGSVYENVTNLNLKGWHKTAWFSLKFGANPDRNCL